MVKLISIKVRILNLCNLNGSYLWWIRSVVSYLVIILIVKLMFKVLNSVIMVWLNILFWLINIMVLNINIVNKVLIGLIMMFF